MKMWEKFPLKQYYNGNTQITGLILAQWLPFWIWKFRFWHLPRIWTHPIRQPTFRPSFWLLTIVSMKVVYSGNLNLLIRMVFALSLIMNESIHVGIERFQMLIQNSFNLISNVISFTNIGNGSNSFSIGRTKCKPITVNRVCGYFREKFSFRNLSYPAWKKSFPLLLGPNLLFHQLPTRDYFSPFRIWSAVVNGVSFYVFRWTCWEQHGNDALVRLKLFKTTSPYLVRPLR
jgi:hypothetical protein